MPAPKGNKHAVGNKGGGRPTSYRPEFADQARKACEAGFTDQELAVLFGVNESTINAWKGAHVEFSQSLKTGKDVADERVERSLYHRAIGYKHEAVKIFMPAGADHPVYAPYQEIVPPDTTACIFWLKNRRQRTWRDIRQHEIGGVGDFESMTDQELVALAEQEAEELGVPVTETSH